MSEDFSAPAASQPAAADLHEPERPSRQPIDQNPKPAQSRKSTMSNKGTIDILGLEIPLESEPDHHKSKHWTGFDGYLVCHSRILQT
jgi:hypothetical protein